MSVHHCGDFRETYAQDMRVMQTRFIRFCILTFVVALYIFPMFASDYLVSVANGVAIAVVGALGINIVTGFTGQISLGQGAFLGVGAYSCAYLQSQFHIPFLIAMPMAGFITAGVGMVFGIPSLRLKGLYLAISTLAAQFILQYLFLHMETFTGGSNGVMFDSPAIGDFVFKTDKSLYYIIVTVAILGVLYAVNLFRSKDGRAFVAVRDHYLSAEIMGIHLFKYRLMSFAISSFYVGIAGCLWGAYTKYITPEHFTINESISYLAMIIIGGLGSVIGSIYGAIFMTLLPIVLTESTNWIANINPAEGAKIFLGAEKWLIVIGCIVAAMTATSVSEKFKEFADKAGTAVDKMAGGMAFWDAESAPWRFSLIFGAIVGIAGAVIIAFAGPSLETVTAFLAENRNDIGDRIMSIKEGIFGLIVILFLIFEPDGMAHRWRLIKAYWKLFPFSY